MRLDARINARLRASTGLVSLVGDEIRPASLESTGAGVLYDVAGFRPDVAHGGTGVRQTSRATITVLDRSFGTARDAATQVRKALSRWSDTVVSDAYFDTERHGRTGPLWLIEQDYTIHHRTT